ncbi:MAG: 3-hydroxyacyl-CoA dehydrogenase/enoyl-CoA hydratase family protein, partial [Bacteroidota bacterium]
GTRRHIRKVAVLGAGIMGSRIAMLFANIGVEALLLDIVPRELTDKEKAKGLTLDTPAVRNRMVNDAFQSALKSKPSPIFHKGIAKRIALGNFEDDMHKIADVDWIIEVVVERLDIKKKVFDQVEEHRKPGTLITSNTSGIPIESMLEGRSEDFKAHFCGTHFFNPPRYLPLLEVIPSKHTKPEIVDFFMHYGDRYLGKKMVLCKDTPAFIANRVGIYSIMSLFHLIKDMGLTVEEVDQLTGKLIGHAKSATFRTADLVGLDTAVKVAEGIENNCPDDERREVFKLPDFVRKMVDNKMWGDKTGSGFYKKTKDESGKKQILSLDLDTLEYRERQKPKGGSIEKAKSEETPEEAMQVLMAAEDKYGEFFRAFSYGLFAYVSHRIPEISDDLYSIDDGMKAGFGWGTGPFEKWDLAGVKDTVDKMKAAGHQPAQWVEDMLGAGFERFYKVDENGKKFYYDLNDKDYKPVPGMENFIILSNLPKSTKIWGNAGSTIYDLGDGIINIEFHTKMNSLGQEPLQGLNHAYELAEAKYRGLVIGNQGENFSAGANIMMILMFAMEGEWDELNMAINYFQQTVTRARYSDIPVVAAPHGLTLGGGCELTMHADAVQALGETYIGLVEVGVGLLPGGGGTKEFAKRMSDRYQSGDTEMNVFQDALMAIAQAKVATSAGEAYGLGILQEHKDKITMSKDRQIADAKARALTLAELGYTRPVDEKIRVIGNDGLGAVEAGVEQLRYGGYASDHDALIARKIGYVLCGGDLSQPTEVSMQYLLDLEREAFLQLCGEKKTQERISHMLQKGKPLRN